MSSFLPLPRSNAAVTRMATLARGGRITQEIVEAEIQRLTRNWTTTGQEIGEELSELIGPGVAEQFDHFDRVQLSEMVRVCRRCSSLAGAGRILFAASRRRRRSVNDADSHSSGGSMNCPPGGPRGLDRQRRLIDTNHLYQDGSVVRYTGVNHELTDERMINVPRYARDTAATTYFAVPHN